MKHKHQHRACMPGAEPADTVSRQRAMQLVRLGGLVALVAASLAGCGGDDGAADVAPPAPTPNRVSTDFTVAGYSNQIDVYETSGATRAVVFLHGGAGTNAIMANGLGMNSSLNRPSDATANWSWLTANKVLAVFPQGASVNGGVATWSNRVMTSGQDDVGLLTQLAASIKARYPAVTSVYLFGHSMGGMMANRMWCEAPTAYSSYFSVAGPASSYYSTATSPCTPPAGARRPYFGIVGGQDTVLQTAGNWSDSIWTVNPALTQNGDIWLTPYVIAEWAQHGARAQMACGQTPAGKTSDGTVDKWTACSDAIQLQEVLSADHAILSIDAELAKTGSGKKVLDLLADFINGPGR